MVKNLPAMRKTWVQSLGWEDPLEEGMATHSSILDWRISMDRGAWRALVHGVVKSWTRLSDFTSLHTEVTVQQEENGRLEQTLFSFPIHEHEMPFHFLVKLLVKELCPTLCDPMD